MVRVGGLFWVKCRIVERFIHFWVFWYLTSDWNVVLEMFVALSSINLLHGLAGLKGFTGALVIVVLCCGSFSDWLVLSFSNIAHTLLFSSPSSDLHFFLSLHAAFVAFRSISSLTPCFSPILVPSFLLVTSPWGNLFSSFSSFLNNWNANHVFTHESA